MPADYDQMHEVTNKISGVIEVPRNTHEDLGVSKDLPFNPIIQKIEENPYTGKPQVKKFYRAPKFDIGFVPRTYQTNFE